MHAHETDTERTRLLNDDPLKPDPERDGAFSKPHQSTYLKGRQLYLALALPTFASLLAAIDTTLTATLAATIASSFNSLSIISSLGTAYLVATSATQPLSGKLSDRYGRRKCFILALVLFALGNLLCGLAQSGAILLVGRAVAGAGGGAMGSITTFIISDLVPLRGRSVWQGVGNCIWAIGMGIGSVLGGLVNEWVGWRWAFIGLAPVTLIAAIGSYFTLPPGLYFANESRKERVDVIGALTFSAALVSLTLGLNMMDSDNSWLVPLTLLVVAATMFLCAIVWEFLYAKDPVIPLRLLADRSVAAACVSSLLVAATIHIIVFYAPLQIQARGYNTAETGSQLLGEPVGAISGSLLFGWAIKAAGGYSQVKPVSFLIFLVAPFGFFFSDLSTPIWVVELCLIALEGGFGGCFAVLLSGLLAATAQRTQAPATAMLFAFRQVGASGGLALAGVFLRSRLAMANIDSLSVVPPDGQKTVDDIEKVCNRHNYRGDTPPNLCIAYNHALHTVFLFTIGLAAAAFVAGMLIRNISLDRDDEDTIAATESDRSDEDSITADD